MGLDCLKLSMGETSARITLPHLLSSLNLPFTHCSSRTAFHAPLSAHRSPCRKSRWNRRSRGRSTRARSTKKRRSTRSKRMASRGRSRRVSRGTRSTKAKGGSPSTPKPPAVYVPCFYLFSNKFIFSLLVRSCTRILVLTTVLRC